MKRILLLSLVLSCVLVSVAAAADTVPSAEQLIAKLKPGHPRLLIDAAGFESLKQRIKTDAKLAEWDKALSAHADRTLKARLPEHVIPDGLRLLATSRRVMGDCYTLALAYRLHGDRRYAERLWKELEAVAAFPDFNPRHFLDTAEMTHGFAIAYDWLYDTWTDKQRATLRRAMIEMGLKPGLKVYRAANWWAKASHNWNQVCNGGMTAGAVAIGDEEPALAGEVLHDAIASVPLAMKSYAPDGAWGEGPGYWTYATTYNVMMIAVLESALGSDFGLTRGPGFAETGLFPLYMAGPTGKWFNFEDSGDRAGFDSCLIWLGERFHQPACTWIAATGHPSPAAMIYYRSPGKDPAAAGLPLDKHFRKVDVVTFRSAWNDPKAVFLGMQAGSNTVNHNHLDLGGFVLDALGQRWAVDLGGDDYNLPGYFGGKRYDYYRLRAEGHNTLVINPGHKADQDVNATARIERFESRPERAFSIADLTPAYGANASQVKRGVALLDRRTVLVEDEIRARQADVWWFMHTGAKITLSDEGRSATLKEGGATLTARILSPTGARFEEMAAAPLASSPQPPKQATNDRVRKLAIHLPKVDETRLAVSLTPMDGKAEQRPAVVPLEKW